MLDFFADDCIVLPPGGGGGGGTPRIMVKRGVRGSNGWLFGEESPKHGSPVFELENP